MPVPSKVDRLPEQLRETLHQLIQCQQYSIDQITDMFDAVLRESELVESDFTISRSAIGRESQKINKIAEQYREQQNIAKALGEQFKLQDLGEFGQLATMMLHNAHFKAVGHQLEQEEIDVEALNILTLAGQRLQRTNLITSDLETRIRKEEQEKARIAAEEARKEAADAVARVAEERGMNVDEVNFWKQQVLGIAPTAPSSTESNDPNDGG